MSDPNYLTEEGEARLRAELQKLIREERPKIAARIAEAKALGDLRENADYEDAKRQQGFLEGRIGTIQSQLANAVRIGATGSQTVQLGSTVKVRDPDGEELTLTLVGVAEANPGQGRISNASPLGKAVLGARAGQVVSVEAPAGRISYEVVSVA